jgi:predicted 3-demethylubiquinone-9 3-methyltransferase (glyoxalase superfamily)
MQKITPFLWFDGNTEEAINFYTSVFKDSKAGPIRKLGDNPSGPAGTVSTGSFTLGGQEFMIINGGPQFKFNESISFFVNCETQEEVDYLWEKLSAGGKESMCGWLKDKFGLSWQIIPSALGKLMGDKDPVKAGRVMQAMLKMRKIDIKALQSAYDNA